MLEIASDRGREALLLHMRYRLSAARRVLDERACHFAPNSDRSAARAMSSKSKRTKLVCRRQLSDQMIANRSLSRDPRILPSLPDAIANAADLRLRQPGVHTLTGAAVTAIHERAVELSDRRRLETDIIVWAAVVKGPRVCGPFWMGSAQRRRARSGSVLPADARGRAHFCRIM